MTGAIGGSMVGEGAAKVTKSLFQGNQPGKKPENFKDVVLEHAPMAATLTGAVLGGMRANKGFNTFLSNLGHKTAFDNGFMAAKTQVKKASVFNELLLRSIVHSTFNDMGHRIGDEAGLQLGHSIREKREAAIDNRITNRLLQDERYESSDLHNLSDIASATGLKERSKETVLGTGLILGGLTGLKASRLDLAMKKNWAQMAAEKIRGRMLGGRPVGRGDVLLALAVSGLAGGALAAVGHPILSEMAGSLTAKLRQGDINRGVDRYLAEKKAFENGFAAAKTAASVTGVMPGLASGLRTTKSFGKIRTARPVSGQSIAPRATPNPIPSPAKAATSAGEALHPVSSATLPRSFSYGNRLMGRWI